MKNQLSAAGANNIKVASVTDFAAGQKIPIDTGANRETAVIAADALMPLSP